MNFLETLRLAIELLMAALTAGCLKSFFEKRKYRQEVEKLRAETIAMRANTRNDELENVRKATEILLSQIVEPLKKELDELRKELQFLQNAVEAVKRCAHMGDCPVAVRLRNE